MSTQLVASLQPLLDVTKRGVLNWLQVHELGDSWAVARESTPGSPFWVVTRYDWSDPTMVRWTGGGE
jgi:hypothetical protein